MSFSILFLLSLIRYSDFVLKGLSSVQLPISQPITDFCIGFYHSCAIFNSDKVKCFGLPTSWGEERTSLGDSPDEIGNRIPYINIGTSLVKSQIECGSQHVCFLVDHRTLKCLGHNGAGQIGIGSKADSVGMVSGYIGDELPFINVGSDILVLTMALGTFHTCVLVTGDRIKCFGLNQDGQLGLGNKIDIGKDIAQMSNNLPFLDLGENVTAISLHSGVYSNHNCIVLKTPKNLSQRIKCWGRNHAYQLGYGLDANNRGDQTGEMGDNLPLVDLGDESRVVQLGLGYAFSCAVLINHRMKCWGTGGSGQLGSGSNSFISSTGNNLPFVEIDNNRIIVLIRSGQDHACIVYEDHVTIKCFGRNTYGQLGQGDITNRGSTPTTIIPLIPAIDLGTESLNITSIHVSIEFNCVVFESMYVKCFGDNSFGQCGVGTGSNIGDGSDEMGKNLQFAVLFSPPTSAPTSSPINAPSKSPVGIVTSNSTQIGFAVAFTLFGVLLIIFMCLRKNSRRKIENDTKYRVLQPVFEQKDIAVYLCFSSVDSQENVSKIVNFFQSNIEGSNQVIFRSNELNVDEIETNIRKSKIFVGILTKTCMENLKMLIEIYIASKLNVRMFFIYVVDSAYELSATQEKLQKILSKKSQVKTISKEIEALNFDPSDVARILLEEIPNVMTLCYESEESRGIEDKSIVNLVDIINATNSEDIALNYNKLEMKRLADISRHSQADMLINSATVDDIYENGNGACNFEIEHLENQNKVDHEIKCNEQNLSII